MFLFNSYTSLSELKKKMNGLFLMQRYVKKITIMLSSVDRKNVLYPTFVV
jgi:hypothetical protein